MEFLHQTTKSFYFSGFFFSTVLEPVRWSRKKSEKFSIDGKSPSNSPCDQLTTERNSLFLYLIYEISIDIWKIDEILFSSNFYSIPKVTFFKVWSAHWYENEMSLCFPLEMESVIEEKRIWSIIGRIIKTSVSSRIGIDLEGVWEEYIERHRWPIEYSHGRGFLLSSRYGRRESDKDIFLSRVSVGRETIEEKKRRWDIIDVVFLSVLTDGFSGSCTSVLSKQINSNCIWTYSWRWFDREDLIIMYVTSTTNSSNKQIRSARSFLVIVCPLYGPSRRIWIGSKSPSKQEMIPGGIFAFWLSCFFYREYQLNSMEDSMQSFCEQSINFHLWIWSNDRWTIVVWQSSEKTGKATHMICECES